MDLSGIGGMILSMRRRPFVPIILLIWLLSACVQAPRLLSQLPTPTLVAAAFVPGDGPGGMPATWTPAARITVDARANFRHMPTVGPTLTPSVVPVLPSRTPRPTLTPTATPTLTPTRYVSQIPQLPPTDELGPSKLGLHVIRNNDPAIMTFVREAQPAVMKGVDDLGFLAEVKVASPRTLTVGRIEEIGGLRYDQNPEAEARRYVDNLLGHYLANPGVDYWEAHNEPDPDMQHIIWYSRFEQERVKLMAQHGLRSAIGGFATGVPELEEFERFTAAIFTAKEHQGILTLHEYGAPDMTYLYGSPLPSTDPHPERGALAFRYRWFYEELLIPFDLVIPLVISEAGVDGTLNNRPGPQGWGWQSFSTYWVEQGLGRNGVEAFINQLAWYDAGVRQDGYVIGFTVFTAGAIGHWKNYDVNPILPELTDYVRSQR